MTFTSPTEIKKKFKLESSSFHKGYFDGFNNPKRSTKELNNLYSSGKMCNISDKTKDFVKGKSQGVEDRLKELV